MESYNGVRGIPVSRNEAPAQSKAEACSIVSGAPFNRKRILSLSGPDETVKSEVMKSRLVGNKSPLVLPACSMMVGIVVGAYVTAPVPLWGLLAAAVVLALLLWRWALAQSVAVMVCFVLLGWLLVDRQQRLLRVDWPEGEVDYEAVVVSEPVEKPKTVAVDILLTESGRRLKCYLYKDGRSRSVRIGDGLRIRSRIRQNSDWRRGTFDYRRYLEIHGFTGSTFVAGWKWQKAEVSLAHVSRLERTRLYFLKLRSRLLERIRMDDEAAYAVVAAMTLGDKSALTQELKEVYAVTGASHVLALSGLHLGIIYGFLSLFVFSRWRSLMQVLLVLSIWAFVFLVGLPTSVVRSALMLSVYALCSLGHRERMSVNTLAFTAIVVLTVNPQSLFDVGFQLSFMAVLAILVVVPLTDRFVSQAYLQSHRCLKWLWGMTAVSVAAQLGVAPLIAYYFGRFSVCFLLTNFIVVPAATLIIMLSLTVIVVPSLAYLLIYIVGWQNTILTKMAAIPGASIDGLHPSLLQVAMVYVVIASVCLLADMCYRGR